MKAQQKELRSILPEYGSGQRLPYAYAGLLGYQVQSFDELAERIKGGFRYEVFENLRSLLKLGMLELATLVDMNPSTLARRKRAGRLTCGESDRLLRVSRVADKAIELFEGDLDAARLWLSQPAWALGEQRPLDLIATEPGALEVERLIDQIEHGVFV